MDTPNGKLKFLLINLLSKCIIANKILFNIPGLKASKSLPEPALFSPVLNKLLNFLKK
jgi:hypothetical protein